MNSIVYIAMLTQMLKTVSRTQKSLVSNRLLQPLDLNTNALKHFPNNFSYRLEIIMLKWFSTRKLRYAKCTFTCATLLSGRFLLRPLFIQHTLNGLTRISLVPT